MRKMVPEARLELARLEGRGILNPLCLPISPLGHERNNSRAMRTWQVIIVLFVVFSCKTLAYV